MKIQVDLFQTATTIKTPTYISVVENVCVYVCVCERDRERQRERDRQRERQTERESKITKMLWREFSWDVHCWER